MNNDPSYDPRSDDIQAQWEQDTPENYSDESYSTRSDNCLNCGKSISSDYVYCAECEQLLTEQGFFD